MAPRKRASSNVAAAAPLSSSPSLPNGIPPSQSSPTPSSIASAANAATGALSSAAAKLAAGAPSFPPSPKAVAATAAAALEPAPVEPAAAPPAIPESGGGGGGGGLPSLLRFPLALLVNLSVSALLYSLAAEAIMAGDLAGVSNYVSEWDQIGALLGARALELGLGWWGGFDGYDTAAFTLLTHFPTIALLGSFYKIRPVTTISSLAIDVVAAYVPFRLLRPVAAVRDPARAPPGAVANRPIIEDLPVQVFASLLGAAVYAFVLYSSYMTWLITELVVNFDGLRDITAAYDVPFFVLILYLLPAGVAAKAFLFTPSTGAKPDGRDALEARFDPVVASLWETVRHNLWGFGRRIRTMVSRLAVLTLFTYFNTYLQVLVTVQGANSQGAASWACNWATAVVFIGVAYAWIGNV